MVTGWRSSSRVCVTSHHSVFLRRSEPTLSAKTGSTQSYSVTSSARNIASVDRHEVDVFRELDDRHDVVTVEFTELVHRHRHRLDAECRQSVLDRRNRERLLSFGVQPIDDGARGLRWEG